MVNMDSVTYKLVYSGLGVGSDLSVLSSKWKVDIDTLKAILHQKIVRETMQKHHQTQAKAEKLKNRWEKGEEALEIAKEIQFTPVMTLWLIMEARGMSRTVFRTILKNPGKIPDKRLRNEVEIAVKEDVVYSPEAIYDQMKRSKKAEETVRKWLQKRNLEFIDEKEAKEKNHKKTPDFLLKKPLNLGNQKIHWIECKASFGDETEVQRDYRKQLKHYLELYGSGIVFYFHGFLDHITLKDIMITTPDFFKT